MGYRWPEYISGPGCSKQLGAFIRRSCGNPGTILVVTGPTISRLGLHLGAIESLASAGLEYTVFNAVPSDPSSDDVETAYRHYVENSCRCIVAIGGGSPIDCAKAVAARAARPKKPVAKLQGLLRVRRRTPPLFAVPTTAGTGSETTVAAVITDSSTHRKISINDPAILPRYAVLDPELTLGLSPAATAATGLDALCHAVEAYTNRRYNTALENSLAKEAVRLIHSNLSAACRNGSSLEARQNLLFASFYAGRAFTRGCVGYVHAIGHTLGGLYGVSHGVAMGALLPDVMRSYGSAVHAPLSELASEIGLPGSSREEKAENFILWLEELRREFHIPTGFDCIRSEDIPTMVSWAMAEANPLYPVPQIWGRKDFHRFIESVRR